MNTIAKNVLILSKLIEKIESIKKKQSNTKKQKP